MSKLLIKGGSVTMDGSERVDFRIVDGRISEVGANLASQQGFVELDARGLLVLPAAIDNHVHFRDPGLTRKEGYETGSRAALQGGVATVLEVQNNDPLLLNAERCREKVESVEQRSLVNFGIYPNLLEASLKNLEEMAPFASAFKLFMGGSTGLSGISDYGLMRELFHAAAATGQLIVLHCEDESILGRTSRVEGLEAVDHGSRARPAVSESLSIAAAIELALEAKARIHVFHLSTKRGLDLITAARETGLEISASTCPHYLYFSEEDYARLGTRIKVNPAIHGTMDREALLEGLADCRIEVFSSDHAPHLLEEKDQPYLKAPSGIPSVDLFYPLLLTLVKEGKLSFERAIDAVTKDCALTHGLAGRGSLAPGSHGDICLVDPLESRVVSKDDLASRVGWTPYEGMRLYGWPVATVVSGHVAYDRRRPQPFDASRMGSFVVSDPSLLPGSGRQTRKS